MISAVSVALYSPIPEFLLISPDVGGFIKAVFPYRLSLLNYITGDLLSLDITNLSVSLKSHIFSFKLRQTLLTSEFLLSY
jgi:hypothetical protein